MLGPQDIVWSIRLLPKQVSSVRALTSVISYLCILPVSQSPPPQPFDGHKKGELEMW